MKEQKWLTSTTPERLVKYVRWRFSDRKLRHFSCACYRRFGEYWSEEAKAALEASEQYADGLISKKEMLRAAKSAERAAWRDEELYALNFFGSPPRGYLVLKKIASTFLAWKIVGIVRDIRDPYNTKDLRVPDDRWKETCHILRDIFGNPFRPVTVDPAWLTPDVTALAQAIYDERRFADMPILADALEEAGCTSDDILDHCRAGGDHTRGCWVVDLLLGKG